MHNIKIPTKNGIDRINFEIKNFFEFIIFLVKKINPIENIGANNIEYPIR